jgi:hypothetical protein
LERLNWKIQIDEAVQRRAFVGIKQQWYMYIVLLYRIRPFVAMKSKSLNLESQSMRMMIVEPAAGGKLIL